MTLEEQITGLLQSVRSATDDDAVATTEEAIQWLMETTAVTLASVLLLASAVDKLRTERGVDDSQ